jgi:serine protease Do
VFAGSGGSYLGVYIREVGAEDVDRLDLDRERGALVTGLAEDGPAAAAGLEENDVIVSWNGSPVESAAQLRRLVSETPAGRRVAVGVSRDGKVRTVDVKLGERGGVSSWRAITPEARVRVERNLERSREQLAKVRERLAEIGPRSFVFLRGGRMGVGLQSLTGQLAEYFGLSDRDGVLVTTVTDGSAAAKAGLKAGDVILALDGEDVGSPGDVARRVAAAEPGPVAVRILRDRKERTVTVELPERSEGTFELEEIQGMLAPALEDALVAPGVFDVEIPEIEMPRLEELDVEIPDVRIVAPEAPGEVLIHREPPQAPKARVVVL